MATRPFRVVAASLAVSIASLGVVPAQAVMVPTAQVAAHEQAPSPTGQAQHDRDAVRALLVAHGVAPGDASLRVEALTDEEARRIATQFDELPAGGEVVVILFTVFAVLLVTDILGLTKVYPFTRPVR